MFKIPYTSWLENAPRFSRFFSRSGNHVQYIFKLFSLQVIGGRDLELQPFRDKGRGSENWLMMIKLFFTYQLMGVNYYEIAAETAKSCRSKSQDLC